MPIKKIGGLQIESVATSQSITFWRVQKIIIGIFIIFLLGVVFGLTGNGVLSERVTTSNDGKLTIRYDIFARHKASAMLSVHINQLNPDISLSLPKSFIDSIYMKLITPTPARIEIQGNNVIYTFSGENSEILFFFEPQSPGFSRLKIGLLQGSSVTINHFVYP